MSNQESGNNLLRLNKQVYYFALIISSISVLVDFFQLQLLTQQILLNSFLILSILILFSLTYVKLMSMHLNSIIFIYTILIYIILTFYFNAETNKLSFFLLKNSLLAILLITIMSLITHHGHILVFGLIYSFGYGIICIIEPNDILIESLTTITIFIFIYAVFLFFSSKYIKTNFHKHALINNKVTIQNQELSQQAQTLNEINKLLSQQTSEIRAQQKELEKLNSTKDKFLSLFAHDLKTPMNSIMGFAELLELKFDDLHPAKAHHYIQTIRNSAEKTYNLIENLLEWSRSQSNNIAYSPDNHDLSDIVDEVFDLLKSSAEKKNIKLVKNNIDQLSVFADKYMLTTVFRNLVANAIKYSRQNSSVILSAIEHQTKTLISVIDKGVGMTEEQVQSLFKIEKTQSTVGTSGEKGTGLGLIICNDFIKKHNSEIKVLSQTDEGTTFSFEITLSKDQKGNKENYSIKTNKNQ